MWKLTLEYTETFWHRWKLMMDENGMWHNLIPVMWVQKSILNIFSHLLNLRISKSFRDIQLKKLIFNLFLKIAS